MPILPVQVLAGPEVGRRNEALDRLRTALAKEWGEPPEEHRVYATETGVGDLLSLLMNGSLFSSGKLVFYHSAEAIKGKADVEALASYVRAPADRTVLALITEAFGIDKAVEEAVGKTGKQTFWELYENEKEAWIADFFKREGVSIDDDAIDALLEIVENNTDALKTECSRLVLFAERGGSIAASDVEAYIAHNREEDAFSLFERMSQGTLEHALGALDAILTSREGSGIGILAGLLWSFRRLATLQALVTDGRQYEEAARSLRITSRKQLAMYDAARRRWPSPTTRDLVAFGVETDARLRSMGASFERTLLELFVYACMIKKAPLEYSAAWMW